MTGHTKVGSLWFRLVANQSIQFPRRVISLDTNWFSSHSVFTGVSDIERESDRILSFPKYVSLSN